MVVRQRATKAAERAAVRFLLSIGGLDLAEVLLDAEALPRPNDVVTVQTTDKHKTVLYRVERVVHPVVMSARAVKYPIVYVKKE